MPDIGVQFPTILPPDGDDNPNAAVGRPYRASDVHDADADGKYKLRVCWEHRQMSAFDGLRESVPGLAPNYYSLTHRYKPPPEYALAGKVVAPPRVVRLVSAADIDFQAIIDPGAGFVGLAGPLTTVNARQLRDRIKATYKGRVGFTYFNGNPISTTAMSGVCPSFCWTVRSPGGVIQLGEYGTFKPESFLGGECLDIVLGGLAEWQHDSSAWPPTIAPPEKPSSGRFGPQYVETLAQTEVNWLKALKHQFKYFMRYKAVVYNQTFTAQVVTDATPEPDGDQVFISTAPYNAQVLQKWASDLSESGFGYGGDLAYTYSVDTLMDLVTDFFPPP